MKCLNIKTDTHIRMKETERNYFVAMFFVGRSLEYERARIDGTIIKNGY